MSKNLKNCMQQLQFIAKIKDSDLRKKVLKNVADDCLYSALNEIALNTVNKKVPLSAIDKKSLRKHRVKIQNLACFTKNKKKRKRLVVQSGGILPFIIPTIASILTSLIAN